MAVTKEVVVAPAIVVLVADEATVVVVGLAVVVVSFPPPPPPPPPPELPPPPSVVVVPLLSGLETVPDLVDETLTEPFVPVAVIVYEHVELPIVSCHDAEPCELCVKEPKFFEEVSPVFKVHEEGDSDNVTSRFPPTSTLLVIVIVALVAADDAEEDAVSDLMSTTLTVVLAA